MAEHYDLIVIGAGPAGEKGASKAAQYGKRVAHVIGEQASELIHIASHSMLKNNPIDAFIDAVYNYPTLSDSYQDAAYDGLENHDKWVKENK